MKLADAWELADPTACPVCGRDGCEDHLPPQTDTSSPHLVVLSAADVRRQPAPPAIIENLAWAGCLTVLVSESGTGKTFVALSIAAHVSADLAWHGRAVQAGSVVYIGYEGDALSCRLSALSEAQGHHLKNVYVVRACDPLSAIVTRDGETPSVGERDLTDALDALRVDLAATDRPPIVLIIIDTIRASLAGSEDSSEAVASYLRAVRRLLARLPDAGAILTHHAGWQDGEARRQRERGSSAFRGNCDATLYLSAGDYDAQRSEAALTLTTLKTRDAELPAPLPLVRRRVYLRETDRHGQPVTSCVIEPDRRTRADREAERVEATQAAQQAFDRRVLGVLQGQSITSVAALRRHVGGRNSAVGEAVDRLFQAGAITRLRQRDPYALTDAGRALAESAP